MPVASLRLVGVVISLLGGGCRRGGVDPHAHASWIVMVELVVGMKRLGGSDRSPHLGAVGACRATPCRSASLEGTA